MSKIHFLFDKSNISDIDLFENEKSLPNNSILHSRQGWQYLIQRILNNQFSNEIQILQQKFNSNIFQRYQNEYQIKEIERIYKAHISPLLYLPSYEIMKSIQLGSILKFLPTIPHIADMKLSPSIVQFDIVMKYSEIKDQKKASIQKRVTIIQPNSSERQASNSLNLSSPKWRASIDEQISYLSNQQRLSDEIRQKNLSRLSLRSTSYGFGLGRRQSDQKKNEISSLPSNKIEFDLNQHDHNKTFKRKSFI